MSQEIWDKRFLQLAEQIASWSKDPSTKVGAVIVAPLNRIVSTGYNGFARNIDDSLERYDNRELKYKLVIHAEANALLFAQRNLNDCSIYVHPFMPCSSCANLIIQSGIMRVVSLKLTKEKEERWKESFDLSTALFNEAGVDLVLYE